MAEEPNTAFQFGLAAFLGSLIGYWLLEEKQRPLHVGLAFVFVFSVLALVSLPDWITFAISSVMAVFVAAFVPFVYYLKKVDERRAARKQERAPVVAGVSPTTTPGGRFMPMPALSLFLLRELPFSRFSFPRWQSVLAITLIGLLVGLDPALRVAPPDAPAMPLWLALALGVLMIWAVFLIIVAFLKWWMRRGSRWDAQGDLFNLVAASWLVSNVLGAGLVAVGVPYLLTLPLWLYAVWVGGNALSGAIPKASLGYSIGGIVIGLIPALLGAGLLVGLVIMAVLGLMPAPAGA